MAKDRPKSKQQTNRADIHQSEKFVQAARELGCDENPAHFDEILKKVARHKPPLNALSEPKKPKTNKPGQ